MMYVVDTNVISELTKKEANCNVLAWLSAHDDELYLTSITIEEMRFGALMLAPGKHKTALSNTIEQIVECYSHRTLSFDASAAEVCAQLHFEAIKKGRTPSIEDLMIAALCVTHDAVLVTRNVRDFSYLDIALMDPFKDSAGDV